MKSKTIGANLSDLVSKIWMGLIEFQSDFLRKDRLAWQ